MFKCVLEQNILTVESLWRNVLSKNCMYLYLMTQRIDTVYISEPFFKKVRHFRDQEREKN